MTASFETTCTVFVTTTKIYLKTIEQFVSSEMKLKTQLPDCNGNLTSEKSNLSIYYSLYYIVPKVS